MAEGDAGRVWTLRELDWVKKGEKQEPQASPPFLAFPLGEQRHQLSARGGFARGWRLAFWTPHPQLPAVAWPDFGESSHPGATEATLCQPLG